ncbi:dicarboxylate/amino acid:cation symporter [Legionella spiritensis]|uniref:dicarboxylate/amino acid:cation symporter n=1 Tax=Legionella spiritensis TaxID=452 RepID=UPI000F6EF210|nr:dicarboxylate/amino acid:cation symporter [Legionella spiritensis]VEG91019.1 C4-dicarboxylic acid, orotate and citrate transporter [Legionella spiritensis]
MKYHSSNRLSAQILVAIVAGIALGILFNQFRDVDWLTNYLVEGVLDWGGQSFIAILKMMVVPVVLVSLVCGSFSLSNASEFGRAAVKTIFLFLLTTAMAISLALLVSTWVDVGSGITPPDDQSVKMIVKAPTLKDTLLAIFPDNPVAAMAEGKMLQIIVFALLIGVAISSLGPKSDRIRQLFRDMDDVVMTMVHLIFYVAPYGIFCLVCVLFARDGYMILGQLVGYFLTVLGTLLLQIICVYALLLKIFTGLSPIQFYRKFWPAMLFAFSTSSSNVSIPVTLDRVRSKLGVSESIASFVIPLGATINMDGTAVMQGVATVFIANSYHIPLGISGYLTVILVATMASIGTAGVPGVGLITLTMVLTQVNLPAEGIAMIIGIDRLLDMVRTAVNISGDATIACIVSNSDAALDKRIFYEDDTGD